MKSLVRLNYSTFVFKNIDFFDVMTEDIKSQMYTYVSIKFVSKKTIYINLRLGIRFVWGNSTDVFLFQFI